MSSLDKILTTAASGMSAESIRLNTIASNLANAGGMGSSDETTYHAKYPVFSEVKQRIPGLSDDDQPLGGVRVTGIKHTEQALEKRYDPTNPLANGQGYVFLTDVNPVEQMTDMISASKEYQANVDVMNTTKNLISQTINVLNSKD